ncbi:MAG: phosphoglycolate phosphatase [Candidatus Bathyarchaeia archaeon]
MVKVSYFAVDVDGTLTDADSKLELAAISEVRRLESRGYRVILTSGQCFQALATLSRYIGACGITVGENGGVIGRGLEIVDVLGDKRKALAGFKILRSKLGEGVKRKPSLPRSVDIVLERTFDVNLGNMILLREKAGARIFDSGFAYHLLSDGVDKGAGLRRAAELFGFDCGEVVAVGDGLNDIELFKSVAYSVALANAPQEVKRAADAVVIGSYGSGFCEAVQFIAEKFGLKLSKEGHVGASNNPQTSSHW